MENAPAAEYARPHRILSIILYGCTIFLSAFLLFQVQPIVGKMLLPRFGGSAAVWSTCLLFFQSLLLLGYLYAHWACKFLSGKMQAATHIALLACSLLTLPISLMSDWKPAGTEDPGLLIIGLMAAAIGLPYFLLSSTGPLLQSWFAREKPGDVPYRLFALSNFGSMLGLLSYPVLVEPNLALHDISAGWSATYAGFSVLCAALAWRARDTGVPSPAGLEARGGRISGSAYFTWAALAACPTVLLMSVTSHLTQNVAPLPFLWVVPLALYLITFMISFEGSGWYRRSLFLPLFVLAVGAMSHDLARTEFREGILAPVMLYCGGLFIACMVCHGELYRIKPPVDRLTDFYLMIAAGGAVGGIFVAILAPRLFDSHLEFPLALLATSLLVAAQLYRRSPEHKRSRSARRPLVHISALAIGFVSVHAAYGIAKETSREDIQVRNFYGTLSVAGSGSGESERRFLVHGAILHGSQFLHASRRHWPTSYYGDNGGAGMAVLATRRMGLPQRVGIIGLGAGTMASYGRMGDSYRFYEINPLVLDLARSQFSFMANSRASIETVLGDARLSLESEVPQGFDALIVDAFSGDSVPVHLLTREAFSVYLRHMNPDGVLAVHISNKNLDLTPVVKDAVEYHRKKARLVIAKEDAARGLNGSTWVLISDSERVLSDKNIAAASSEFGPKAVPWTDQYSSIYAIIR